MYKRQGPERLLDALRALSQTPSPPVTEVDKWYRRLDQFLETCSTEDNVTVVSAFLGERLIFSQEEAWATSRAVYLLSGEDDVPEVSVIRATVADLALWRRVGVAERPTVERAIAWLVSLAPGYAPVGADLRRIRALLARYPGRIWHECGHWLNLQGEWSPTGALKYALTMQSLVPWSHLFPWVKQQTADLRFPGDVTRDEAFTALAGLAFMGDGNIPGRGQFGDNVKKCVEYILANCTETGLITTDANSGPMYGHGFATLFLGEVYGMTAGGGDTRLAERTHAALLKACRLIERCLLYTSPSPRD